MVTSTGVILTRPVYLRSLVFIVRICWL